MRPRLPGWLVEQGHQLIDQVLQDHVAQVDFDLCLLILIVEPVVLLFHCLCGQDLRQSLLSVLLKELIIELLFDRVCCLGLSREAEDWTRKATTESLAPSEHLLLDHLEKSLSVNRADFHLGLEPPDLVRPRHWFSCQTIRSELHKAFVDSIKEALVLDVNALPHQLSLLARVGTLTSNHGLLSCLFNL